MTKEHAVEMSLNDLAARLTSALAPVPGFDRAWVFNDRVAVVDVQVGGRRIAFDLERQATGGDALRLDVLAFCRDGAAAAPLAQVFPGQRADGKHLVGTAGADGDPAAETAALIAAALPRLQAGLPDPLPAVAGAKKVGVLTLPLNNNYGGNLQAFALMEALKKLGHQPVLINRRYQPPNPVVEKPEAIAADVARPLLSDTIGLGAAVPNTSFIDTYLQPITRPFGTTEQMTRNIGRLGLDAIVAGSDQVWRPRYTKGFLMNFFFDFLPEESRVKRISYAASFGAPDWEFSEDQTRSAARLIGLFDAVGVREDEAVTMCRSHLGAEAVHVLDPTLLLQPEDYVPVLSTAPREPNPGQVLSYVLDLTDDKVAVVNQLATALSLGAFSTDGMPFPAAEGGPTGDKTVQGWLAAFHEAAFVVTDSFHGVAFSILFNKPFIAYGNPQRGLARFTSLLKMVGLEERLVIRSSDIDLDRMMQPVNWAAVNARLAALRVDSFSFLSSALEGERKPRKPLPVAGGGLVLDVPLAFETDTPAWQVSSRDGAAVLSVAPGGAVLGNTVWCPLPVPLQPNAQYRLTLDWAFRSAEEMVKPCIRNPQTGKIHVLGFVGVTPDSSAPHRSIVNFTAPGEGFTQFVLGAASFTGPGGGAQIGAISLQKTAGAGHPTAEATASYAEHARKLALKDSERYANAFATGSLAGGARARLMYYAHALEKGLSHMNFRAGFGKGAMDVLVRETEDWLAAGRSPEDGFFKAAISSLHVYFRRHRDLGVDVSAFWTQFAPPVRDLIEAATDSHGGVVEAHAAREPVPQMRQNRPFLDVAYGRRSIREFTDAPIDEADILAAVRVASQAPSVCNRQGPRAHYFTDPDQIRALVDLQGGFGGYKKPPALLLVTCDLTAFVQPKERNQAFIDGGLFMMGLLLGLENAGLGTCSLNTTMETGRERELRGVLKIPETEVLIAFVAVGHYDPAVLIPRSVRYLPEELLTRHGRR